tara:strand:- start:652 stop:990 length:339 start_codon:yes stop_codon:yes gene_type:complete
VISINRNEVWWVNFDPSIGGEIKKVRPAVIVSNNYSNSLLNRVQVVPITSNVEKCYPCEAYITVDSKKAKAMADQITTVSKKRLKDKISVLTTHEMELIERAISIQLDMKLL